MPLRSPLDLEYHLVTVLAGNPEIFCFVAILLISFLMSVFKLGNKLALVMFVIFAIIMSQYIGGIYVLVITLVGFVVFYSLSKMSK